jgi:hypothetical protein
VSGYERVTGTASANDDNNKTATATCPSGKVVVGGGFVEAGSIPGIAKIGQSQATSDTVWTVFGRGDGINSWSLQAFAVCVTTP